jgi:fructose-1,6-bisphosphatase/inositol monophosphatase family enzyme
VLADMVDGTDLLEMNIPMWCSAIVIFDPTPSKILGTVVGQASGEIYFATADQGAVSSAERRAVTLMFHPVGAN